MSAGETELDPNEAAHRAFARYVLGLMQVMYSRYVWSLQDVGVQQQQSKLDLVGTRLPDDAPDERAPNKIGVQVRLLEPTLAPSDEEWSAFLAGCFLRRIDLAFLVTTGCLTGDQVHEASEAGVIVIADAEAIARVADQYGYARFEVEASTSGTASQSTPRARRPAPN